MLFNIAKIKFIQSHVSFLTIPRFYDSSYQPTPGHMLLQSHSALTPIAITSTKLSLTSIIKTKLQ
uniref:Uncharacterized protein n=1 Tax=Octopus bimaculoides TaxID=37653 RepID=A0A0L8FYX8_OCTBM